MMIELLAISPTLAEILKTTKEYFTNETTILQRTHLDSVWLVKNKNGIIKDLKVIKYKRNYRLERSLN